MSLLNRIRFFLRRRLSSQMAVRPLKLALSQPLISFTFDDFPASALYQGGAILADYGISGTYYASLGLMGQKAPTGHIFDKNALEVLMAQKHELGCHTFDHCHAWETSASEFEASIQRNQRALRELIPNLRMESHSYPISGPRPATKRVAANYFSGSRGGGQTFNRGCIDLNLMHAFFIEQSREYSEVIFRTIDANTVKKGWLIFATHDVIDSPTRFGCTPALFREIVAYSAKSGAKLLSVSEALRAIQARQQQAKRSP